MQNHNQREPREFSDTDLCELVKKNNCEQALYVLHRKHAALVVSIATRLSKKYDNWSITQEIIDDALYLIYLSAQKYNPDKKTKFSTFLGNETKWAYLNKCNKVKNSVSNLSKLELVMKFVSEDNLSEEDANQDELLDCIYSLVSTHPDSRIHEIFKLRYKVGKNNTVMPWHSIGYNLGLSAQGCINIHNSGISYIKEKLKKEGIKC